MDTSACHQLLDVLLPENAVLGDDACEKAEGHELELMIENAHAFGDRIPKLPHRGVRASRIEEAIFVDDFLCTGECVERYAQLFAGEGKEVGADLLTMPGRPTQSQPMKAVLQLGKTSPMALLKVWITSMLPAANRVASFSLPCWPGFCAGDAKVPALGAGIYRAC